MSDTCASVNMKYEDHEIVIREAVVEDMEEVARMIQELADFEKMPDGPKIGAKELARDFTARPPHFRCLVAHRPHSPRLQCGYALFVRAYSTWEGPALHLEDLYVTPAERGRGVGGRLFRAVAREAVSSGCSRLNFSVLAWNPAAAFYRALGAADLTEREAWHQYRLAGAALLAAAGRPGN